MLRRAKSLRRAQLFDVYISDGVMTYGVKIVLSTHGLGNIYLIPCFRSVSGVMRAIPTTMIVLLTKIAGNVKISTIPTKRLT